VATLIRPGFEADQWVGNACVTTPEYEKDHLSRRWCGACRRRQNATIRAERHPRLAAAESLGLHRAGAAHPVKSPGVKGAAFANQPTIRSTKLVRDLSLLVARVLWVPCVVARMACGLSPPARTTPH